jgi:hypothetical protein
LQSLSRRVQGGDIMLSSHAGIIFAPDVFRNSQDSEGGDGRNGLSPLFHLPKNLRGCPTTPAELRVVRQSRLAAGFAAQAKP